MTNNHNWNTKKMQELASFEGGGTPSRKKSEYFEKGTIPWVKTLDLNNAIISRTEECITELGLKKSSCRTLPKDSILIAMYGGFNQIGRTGLLSIEATVNQAITAIILDKNKLLPRYLLFYLNFNVQKWKKFAVSSRKDPNITKEDIKKMLISFPSAIYEQHKIVEVLETWDKAIQLTRKLIEQKELQKKELLQRLVYKQPETTSYFLGQLFTLGRGRVISKEEIAQNPGAYPVYSSQTASNGVLGNINTFDFDGEYITWTTDGANAGKVFYRTGKFNCTNVCGTAHLKQKNQHNLYYIMSYLNNVTKKYVSYVGNPKLMNGVFANILLLLPSKEFQDKVATLLITLDKKIELLRQKLNKLEEQKKGLMQILLTGKVRLNW